MYIVIMFNKHTTGFVRARLEKLCCERLMCLMALEYGLKPLSHSTRWIDTKLSTYQRIRSKSSYGTIS